MTAIQGIAFQSDGKSTIGALFIRPLEGVDRWLAGLRPGPDKAPLAMHAGIRVTIDGSRDYVVEQLVGTWDLLLRNGLNWTPYETFSQRDRGGWDVTVPLTQFRGIQDGDVERTRVHLNTIQGHPFVGEDCTEFIERAFFGRRLFADSPLLQRVGISARVGDPALPLLRADARLEATARELLQFDRIADVPDPAASADSPNMRLWVRRLVPVVVLAWAVGHVVAARYSSGSRRSRLASSTARRFLR